MPFDENLILRGKYTTAVIDLEPTEAVAVSLTVNSDGAKCLDLKETGAKGMAAVLTVPAEPTTYADILTAIIEASDHLDRNWATVADFPVLNALMRKIKLTATTAFVASDIGKTITKDTSLDAGVILTIDEALFTEGGSGYILLSMIDSADLFTLDANVGLTTDGTGAGDLTASGLAVPTVGESIVRFTTDKRYVRGKYTVSTGGNFGKVEVLLAYHPFKTL